MHSHPLAISALFLLAAHVPCALAKEDSLPPGDYSLWSNTVLHIGRFHGGGSSFDVDSDFVFKRNVPESIDGQSVRTAYDDDNPTLFSLAAAKMCVRCVKVYSKESSDIVDEIGRMITNYKSEKDDLAFVPLSGSARQAFVTALRLMKDAKTRKAQIVAAEAFRDAVTVAPWNSMLQYDCGMSCEAAGGVYLYDALVHFKIYRDLQQYQQKVDYYNLDKRRAARAEYVKVSDGYSAELRQLSDKIGIIRAKLQEEWNDENSNLALDLGEMGIGLGLAKRSHSD